MYELKLQADVCWSKHCFFDKNDDWDDLFANLLNCFVQTCNSKNSSDKYEGKLV